ncbi:MAG: hypothetical protein JWM28_3629 [Chitinophagaceae bacterium]|nr:hypothetical protein [Chitinophagaceae bacterium]
MKLSGIKLEPSVISDLYKKTLVESDTPGLPEKKVIPTVVDESEKKSAGSLHFLGENKKNILVLVSYNLVNYLPDEELAFLTNMLSACQLGIADVAILNVDKAPALSYMEITGKLNSRIILLFGIAPSSLDLPIDFPHFQVQSFNNTTILYTPLIEDIKNNKIFKSKLWVCLRKIFNV